MTTNEAYILLKKSAWNYITLPDKLKKNREVCKFALQIDGNLLMYATDFQNDEELVLIALENEPLALRYASENFSLNEKIINQCIKVCPEAFQFVHPEIMKDKKKIIKFIQVAPSIIKYLDPEVLHDTQILLKLLYSDIGDKKVSENFLMKELTPSFRKKFKNKTIHSYLLKSKLEEELTIQPLKTKINKI